MRMWVSDGPDPLCCALSLVPFPDPLLSIAWPEKTRGDTNTSSDSRRWGLSPEPQAAARGPQAALRDQAALCSVPRGESSLQSEPRALPLQRELSPSPVPSLQCRHVPLYLEWAPVGVFSSSAPQKKEPRDPPAGPAEEGAAEPETCKS